MKETVVLYTDKERGKIHHLFTDLSYLDKEWFEENPVKPPEENENESTSEPYKSVFRVDSSGSPGHEEKEVILEHKMSGDSAPIL